MFQSPRSGKFVSDIKELCMMIDPDKLFQSPRSGKFVSDLSPEKYLESEISREGFQSPRSGKFVSDTHATTKLSFFIYRRLFQSPRSGRFVSDMSKLIVQVLVRLKRFNPLDRGKLYLM